MKHRNKLHMFGRAAQTAALMALAHRIGFRRGSRLLALATAAFLEEKSRSRGRHRR